MKIQRIVKNLWKYKESKFFISQSLSEFLKGDRVKVSLKKGDFEFVLLQPSYTPNLVYKEINTGTLVLICKSGLKKTFKKKPKKIYFTII